MSAWAELYEQTQHWKSNVLCYTDKLRFLRRLMDNYFNWITGGEHLYAVRELEMDLLETVRKCEDLLPKARKQMTQLAVAVEDPENKSTRDIRTEHENLGNDIFLFVQKFKTVRNDVFRVSQGRCRQYSILEFQKFEDQTGEIPFPTYAF